MKFLENNDYEILTPDGWCDFDGIQQNGIKKCIKIKTNTKEISCTPDHKIVNNGNPIEAQSLKIGDKLNNEDIIDITDNGDKIVYDIINTGPKHTFLCNDIPVKNCDEFAFVDRRIQDQFLASAFPTILSGQKTKLCIISTPNGQEKFYELFTGAQKGTNNFAWLFVDWRRVPGRDENWKKMAIDVNGLSKFKVEHECQFEGSTNTLIAHELLEKSFQPAENYPDYNMIQLDDNPKNYYEVYSKYDPHSKYYIEIDPSSGSKQDYTIINVQRCKDNIYEQAALWKCNSLDNNNTLEWIIKIASDYNNPVIGVECNGIGEALAERLYYEKEYENLLLTKFDNKTHKWILYTGGFMSGSNIGIKTTNVLKLSGADRLRNLFSEDRIILHSNETVKEFEVFVRKGNSYCAESGHHDDIAMTYVLFAWVQSFENFIDLIGDGESYIVVETPPAPFYKNADEYMTIDEFLRR